MSYPIIQKLLPVGVNRPGTKLTPVGVIIHETATPNATAKNEAQFFAGGNRNASAHYFIDYQSIIRVIPENEVAWHAGPTANHKYLSIELCHFNDTARFTETWKRAVWLAADMCKRYGWNPETAIHSHAWVSRTYHETDHTDPEQYFAAHGTNMNQFIADVKKAMSTQIIQEAIDMFKDFDKVASWAKPSVQRMEQLGLIKGDEAGNFNPTATLTRQEFAVVLDRLLRLLGR